MEKLDLEVKEREKIGNQLGGLRRGGIIPAVVYGRGIKSQPVQVDEKLFTKHLSRLSSKNVILNLKVDGGNSIPVMMHDIQRDIISDRIIHVDFRKVVMDEEIKAKVQIVLLGESEGVKSDGGILVNPLREIEIKALPSNIPAKIEINISELKIGDAVHVSNLPPMSGVEFITPAQEIIVTISPPTKEEEIAPPEVAPEAVPGAVPPEGAVPAAPGAAPGAPAPAAAPAAEAAPPAKAEKPKK